MANYSEDYLLDKRVKIFQPLNGYRASIDAVILSSLIGQVKNGDKILDMGSGTGAISLCLAERFKTQNVEIVGLEYQEELALLANKSAEVNGFDFVKFINANIYNKPVEFCSFNHVISNPPYTDHDMPSPNPSKALAHNGYDFSLSEWIKVAIKMLKPQGNLYMINRAEATSEILATIHGKLGRIRLTPLYSKDGQDAKRILITAQKDSKAPLTIDKGLVAHNEKGDYTKEMQAILREGQSFFNIY